MGVEKYFCGSSKVPFPLKGQVSVKCAQGPEEPVQR